ncbi:DUF2953 domain-containing protein [Clostridium sp. 'White wine YQ']|uniref:DUF2953 domain-containing protein n=1 Tax=Clostridium sp. 'White wine YQ' TaxID=3027474 RepID=UPI002365CC6B|nr:DUF2953 domain-containing protein [Clostridium sp. 'White wine YQ']MDD7793878.1 DUF2953 domain-containing protein [Clostridium sp. 'White wine YQ']
MFYALFTLFLIIILFPIPIKFRVEIDEFKIKVFLYKKLILDKDIFSLIKKEKAKPKTKEKKKDSRKYKLDYLNIVNSLKKSTFKPILKYRLQIDYDLSDAYPTAILNGLITPIAYVIHGQLIRFLKVTNYKIKITPKFNNSFYLYFSFKGIIYVNLVKITIIGFKILKSIKKEVSPLREAYGQ